LREKLGFQVCAYTIRHTWATEALERGVDPISLAILMGHKDTTMVAKVYQHLAQNRKHLREQLRRATGGEDAA
jgi:integrase